MNLFFPKDRSRTFFLNSAAGGISNIIKILIQLLLLPTMARLLGPEEFGLYALALPTVAFFTVLADGGIGMSLAREPESSEVVWSSAFWALLISCSLIALSVLILGFLLGNFADQPRLPGIMALLSVSFFLMAFSALPAARLTRRGNLVYHSIGDLASSIIGAIIAIVLAFNGFGAWSLAIQYVTGSLVRAVIFNIVAFEKPLLVLRLRSVWPHVIVGSSVISSRLTEFIGRAIETTLFGRIFGASDLGAYTLANQISRFICEAAGNPLWGSFYAQAIQDDITRVRIAHINVTRFLSIIIFPTAALLSASAPQVLTLFLGAKWLDASLIAQIILPFYALNTIASLCNAVFLANGWGKEIFFISLIYSSCRVMAVISGFYINIYGVAWGISFANFLFFILEFYFIQNKIGSITIESSISIIKVFLSSLIAALVCYFTITLPSTGTVWILFSLCAGIASYIFILSIMDGRQLFRDIKFFIKLFKR